MADLSISQIEADALISMEKHATHDSLVDLPDLGGYVSVPLISANPKSHENFLLDVSRGRIDLRKGTHQLRGRQVIVLVRLDFGGPPHRNPDGEEVGSPHLRIYREGFGAKWAMSVPERAFPHLSDNYETLLDFLRFCNVTKEPRFQRGIFT